MKIQLDTTYKTITVEENVNLGELIKAIEKLLPKDSPFGYWKDFTLQSNTTIYSWTNPIYVPYYNPAPLYTFTGGDETISCDAGVYNVVIN